MRQMIILALVCLLLTSCAVKQPKGDKVTPAPALVTTKVWFDSQNRTNQEDTLSMETVVDSNDKVMGLGIGTIIGLVTPFLESAIDHGYDALVNYINSEKSKYSAAYSGLGSTHLCYDANGKVVTPNLTFHLQHGTFDNQSNQTMFSMDFDAEFLTNYIRIKPTSLVFNKSSARKAKDDKDFAVTVEFLTFAMAEDGSVSPKVFAAYDYKFAKVPVGADFNETALENMESQYMSLPVASKGSALCYPIAVRIKVIETEDIPVLLDIIAKSTADAKTETTKQLKDVLKEILDELKEEDKE